MDTSDHVDLMRELAGSTAGTGTSQNKNSGREPCDWQASGPGSKLRDDGALTRHNRITPKRSTSTQRLDVSFQEAVHSALTGNSEVAKPPATRGEPNGHAQECPLTPKGREVMVRPVIDKGLSKAEAARQFNTTPKTVAKWVAHAA